MTYEGWKEAVLLSKTDEKMFDLLVQLLVEQDAAKARLTRVFGWTGLPWEGLVDEVFKHMSDGDHDRMRGDFS